MRIYYKENSVCDYTSVHVTGPTFLKEEYKTDEANMGKVYKLVISFETGIAYDRCDYYISFVFKILGFGFSFVKQWGY